MKSFTVSLWVLIVMCAGSAVNAQCGCGGGYRPAPVVSHYAPPPVSPVVRPSMSPSSIAYVNKLATPVPRANYTLNYAIHLTDGRVLLSDFLPPGYTVRGIESQTGAGGRRLSTSGQPTGSMAIIDPNNNSTIAVFNPR